MPRLVTLLLILVLTISGCTSLPTNGTVVSIPLPDSNAKLAATTYRPQGNGPFPLVVVSHGTHPTDSERAGYGYWYRSGIIETFLSKGYAVLVPIRRGYGATGGTFMEGLGNSHCNDPEFYQAGLVAAQDILAAVRYGASLPYVDKRRILLAGQSWGGVASLAAASQRPDGVIAVANMGGGHCGNPVRYPGKPRHPDRMAEAIGKYAKTIDVPVLWHYAENDKFFSPDASKLWFDAFTQNGGKGKFVLQPPFGSDGHMIFIDWDGVKLWAPAVDQFLSEYALK